MKKFTKYIVMMFIAFSFAVCFAGCGQIPGGSNQGKENEGKDYSIYLGAGYNILESSYYNQDDAIIDQQILDVDKLASKGYVSIETDNTNSDDTETIISSSLKEYSLKVNSELGLEGDISFLGSLSANFAMDYSEQTTTKDIMVTTRSVLTRKRDFLKNYTNSILASNLTEGFKTDVNSLSPENLVKKYGTHILTDVLLGGKYELNYVFRNSTTSVDTSLSTSIKASMDIKILYLSGTAGISLESSNLSGITTASTIIRSYGGSGSNSSSIETARESYSTWLASLDNTNKVTLVDCSNTVAIWDIIAEMGNSDSKEKSDEVKSYFMQLHDEYQSKMKDPTTPVSNVPYVKRIHIGEGNSKNEAISYLLGKGVKESNIVNIDLNESAEGKYIYLGWTTTYVESEAIRGICAGYYDDDYTETPGTIKHNGYNYVRQSLTDCNEDAGGYYIYVYATQDSRAGDPITNISYKTDVSKVVDGYSTVLGTHDGYSFQALDFNEDAGGTDIYLIYTTKVS